ncbi:MAG: beta-ketoacyl-[acyl-carrier-protein] synthase family protein [Elusimicrobiota bacterium]|jgi:3-oxoacyl-[acyl-carrier-protein] synthase II|nr:beta-ketoacyl-[acyl-carrier-protein] synthase family protein [Elusimicrobiota bacterium]
MSESKRVVITGAGALSPYGVGVDLLVKSLLEGKSALSVYPALKGINGINSHIAGVAPDIDFTFIPRQYRRSMTKMSLFATMAATEALKTAKLESSPKDAALYLGSTISSMEAWIGWAQKYLENHLEQVKTTAVFQVMNNSPLANVAQALGIKGAGFGVCNACATGLVNIGLAYTAIKAGLIESALCGGTDEYHPMMTGCFSMMNAASSQFNDEPAKSSRPFDKDRGGIVCSEGSGIIYIETLDNALARGADILAEIIGFACNTETKSISHPSSDSIIDCMEAALKSAKIAPKDVDMVNAHATSTLAGDEEEAKSIAKVFGPSIKVNSLKGHLGHTMAASGSLELIAISKMMLEGKMAPTLNLDNVDPACQGVDHIRTQAALNINTFVKNSFALGGTNASMIIRRYIK